MRIAKDDVDVKMNIPGAVIRQQTDFGDASGLGKISGEYFTLAAGVGITPCSKGWKAIYASVLTGVLSFVASSPRPTKTAHKRRLKRMISFTGRPGTM